MDDDTGSSKEIKSNASFGIGRNQNSENSMSTQSQPPSSSFRLVEASNTFALNTGKEAVNRPEEEYCRSPADLIDIFSDIVDDIAQLTGLASIVAPLTDSDPRTECLQQSMIDYLKHDLEYFLTEGNACDRTCAEDREECVEKVIPEIGAAGEPELEPLDDDNHNTQETVRLTPSDDTNLPQGLYVPIGYSKKNVAVPPRKVKKPKMPKEEPEKPKPKCCGCSIL